MVKDPEGHASRFYVFVRDSEGDVLSTSSVVFEVDSETTAQSLCRLLDARFGSAGGTSFQYEASDLHSPDEEILLHEALDDLACYDDPDPGIYEPSPPQSILLRAQYMRQASRWLELLNRQEQHPKPEGNSPPVNQENRTPSASADNLLGMLLTAIEKHRLTFLYFAVPKRRNPLNRDSFWESLPKNRFPNIPSNEIDSDGAFLFKFRRRFDHFAQDAISRFGTGEGCAPRIQGDDGQLVDVAGGSRPVWELDETACCYMDDSADGVLNICRQLIRLDTSRRYLELIRRARSIVHDEEQTKWYASNLVRWNYLQRLDDLIHAIKTVDIDDAHHICDEVTTSSATTNESAATSQDLHSDIRAELTSSDAIPEMSVEDRRNSSLILLLLFAQAYYRMLEATVSLADWCSEMDLELNASYHWTVQNLTNLLKNEQLLSDFPITFEPALPDLFPSTLQDWEWQDMMAPSVEQFLATVQKYVTTKGYYEPEERSPAWIMVEMMRPGVMEAIKRADAYHQRVRRHIVRLFGERKPTSSGSRLEVTQGEIARESTPDATNTIPETSEAAQAVDVIPADPLSERAQDVLVAMHQLQAFDSDQRQTTEEISRRALGDSSDPNALKSVMSDLKTRKLIESKTGRGGGCWLTVSGRSRAEKLARQ